jgi:threonine synthase
MKKAEIACTNCARSYPKKGVPYRCSHCGGVFDYLQTFSFDSAQIERSRSDIWRYRHSFGLPDSAPAVSLGEGNTPLVWSEAFGRRVAFKCEFLNPTGSFKDRGTATLVSALKGRGVKAAVEDSSGNAGASFAAYAARAGIQAQVYVPEAASGAKRRQIEVYGARVIAVPGPRSQAAEVVHRAAETGMVYASHAYLPFNLPGYATLAYELYESLGESPGAVFIPAGQGGLLLGVARGFQSLRQVGLIAKFPKLVGVQASACAPLWALATLGAEAIQWVSAADTLAEGVRTLHPVRGDAVVAAVKESGGLFVSVDEPYILPGRDELAKRGLYVEPTSALVWRALEETLADLPEPLVVVLTGSGLKT